MRVACSVPVCLECGNSRCDSVLSSGEPDLSRAHLAHQHQHHRDETVTLRLQTCCVCHSRSLSAVCLLAFVNEPDDRAAATACPPRVGGARCCIARHLGRPARRTPWLTALEQQVLAQSHLPACYGALIRATGLS